MAFIEHSVNDEDLFLTDDQFDEMFELDHDNVERIDPDEDSDVLDREDIKTEFSLHGEKNIWTYVDGDEGASYLISGYHYVNAYGYAITKQAHNGRFIEVTLNAPDEETVEDEGDFED